MLVAGDAHALEKVGCGSGDVFDRLLMTARRAGELDGRRVAGFEIELVGVPNGLCMSGMHVIGVGEGGVGAGATSGGGHQRISVVLVVTVPGVGTGSQGQQGHKGQGQGKDLFHNDTFLSLLSAATAAR